MPVYEYICNDCDTYFTELKKLNDFDSPSYCPDCQQPASKIISTPHLNTMRKEIRKAHETNELSANEPKVKHKHTCGAHCHHHKQEKSAPAYKQQTNSRPWMLGH